jgi:hypothetical protein
MTLHVVVRRRWIATLALFAVAAFGPEARRIDPLIYTIRFPDPASRTSAVELVAPTETRAAVDLMMPALREVRLSQHRLRWRRIGRRASELSGDHHWWHGALRLIQVRTCVDARPRPM